MAGLNTENTTRRNGPKPNGRAPQDESEAPRTSRDVATAANTMDNLLAQLLILEGPQLRAVFDRAVEAHNALVTEEKNRFQETVETLETGTNEAQTQIDECYQLIAKLTQKIESLAAHRNEEELEHAERMDKLDHGRSVIENMMQLFKHKLDGFVA